MLFLIIALGCVQRHRCHRADGLADLIIAKGENGVIKLVSPAAERLEGLAVKADHAAGAPFTAATYSLQRWPIIDSSLQAMTTPSPSITPTVRSVFSFNCRTTF